MNANIGCTEAGIRRRDLDCTKTLRSIQKKCESAERGRFARHVGCADVAAAAVSDVFATEDADKEIAKRNRAEKITSNESEDYFRHAFSWQDAGEAPAPHSALP